MSRGRNQTPAMVKWASLLRSNILLCLKFYMGLGLPSGTQQRLVDENSGIHCLIQFLSPFPEILEKTCIYIQNAFFIRVAQNIWLLFNVLMYEHLGFSNISFSSYLILASYEGGKSRQLPREKRLR